MGGAGRRHQHALARDSEDDVVDYVCRRPPFPLVGSVLDRGLDGNGPTVRPRGASKVPPPAPIPARGVRCAGDGESGGRLTVIVGDLLRIQRRIERCTSSLGIRNAREGCGGILSHPTLIGLGTPLEG